MKKASITGKNNQNNINAIPNNTVNNVATRPVTITNKRITKPNIRINELTTRVEKKSLGLNPPEYP
jgi:hypothetical protein